MTEPTSEPSSANIDQPEPVGGYSHEHRPLAAYSGLVALHGVAFGAGLTAAARRRGGLPERLSAYDLVTTGIATHKLSRLITKDKVTGFIRAPFVRFQEATGHGEVSEEPRGAGLRLAIGELLVCPYCLAQWIASAFAIGHVGAPRFTRMIAFIYTVETVSDFLQLAYKAGEDATS